jgi:hypothetical protein
VAAFGGSVRSRRVSRHTTQPMPPRTSTTRSQIHPVGSSVALETAAAAISPPSSPAVGPVGAGARVAPVGPVMRAVLPVGWVGCGDGDSFGGFSVGDSVGSGASVGE